jgi:hypothetical protein
MTTAILLAALLQTQTPQVPPCHVANNDTYAYTKDQPVQVGGSAMYARSREERYLNALRGPDGQPIKYRRLGSQPTHTNATTFLDIYEVTYDGLEKPITLYLDAYHYNPIRVPQGFTCGQPFNLGPPPLDGFREIDQLRAIAVEQGATRDFDPIPLVVDGVTYGAIYDEFRLIALASRAAARQGKSLDPNRLPVELAQAGMVIVAYPPTCEGKTFTVASALLIAQSGGPVPRESRNNMPAEAIARLLPGIQLPKGSIAAAYQLRRPRANDRLLISYMENGCGVTNNGRWVPLTVTEARGVQMPLATPPAGVTIDAPMLLQGLIDLDGKIQRPEYVGGQRELVTLAKENLAAWKVEPARVNGAPIATGVLAQVQFVQK